MNECQIDFPSLFKKVTDDLVRGQETWKTQNIVGVGSLPDGGGKIRILMLQKQTPPELTAYINALPAGVTVETRITGPFHFAHGAGSGATILSEGVSGFGTMTAVVEDQHNDQFLLSCHHVLGPVSSGIYAWDTQKQIATTDQVVLWETEPITADAALARPVGKMPLKASFPRYLSLQSKEPVDMQSGDNVAHFGAATAAITGELATSQVAEVKGTLKVNIHGVPRIFENIGLAGPTFALKGDSGSLVVNTDKNQPTGIVFAKGQFEGTFTAVAICSLNAALTALGVTLA